MKSVAAIHVAKKQLGLDEDTYRSVLERVTGKSSSKEMSEADRGRVLEEFGRLGFTSSRPAPASGRRRLLNEGGSRGVRKRLEGKYAAKLQALWIAAWNLGIVENRDDAALVAFVKRQTGIDHVRFLRHGDDAAKAIEALKAWMAREAGVDWAREKGLPAFTQMDGYRIALAQWVKAKALFPDLNASFQEFVERIAGVPVASVTRAGWIAVMNELGQMIRKAQS